MFFLLPRVTQDTARRILLQNWLLCVALTAVWTRIAHMPYSARPSAGTEAADHGLERVIGTWTHNHGCVSCTS